MALTGLQIQKLLPKTNCKECGSNTCLAFAMKLAAKKAELSECPYASDEAKAVLGAASEPPVKTIKFGLEKGLKLGDETVLYRHERTFVNQTILAVNINDTDNQDELEQTLKSIKEYEIERVGEILTVEMVSITQKGSDPESYAKIVKQAFDITNKPLLLRSSNFNAIEAAAKTIKDSNSVIASVTKDNVNALKIIATENGLNLAITGENIDEIVELTTKLKDDGFNNLLIELPAKSFAEQFQISSIARKMAIKGNFKPLGYPHLRFLSGDDDNELIPSATVEINKYGGICVLPKFDPALLVSLMTLRLNIYTDPQKPIQVDPKAYPIGEPTADSPVFLTTNFSLTYFIVSGEIENSGINAWLVVPQCEGMSVLTAWAAGKFSGAQIAKAIREMNLEEQVTTREIVIPGYVSQISGELEECLPGWKVVVGPQEASDIESFVKAKYARLN